MKARLLAIVAVAVSSILAFDRSFDSESWILPGILAAVAPIALILGTRALWRRPAIVAMVAGLAGLWYLVITLVPSTTFYGLPSATSLRAIAGSGYQAIATMRTTVVPITPGVGHLSLLFGWSWIGGIWSALGIKRGLPMAIAPWLLAFTYASLVGMPQGRGAFSSLFLSAITVALYVWGKLETRVSSSRGLSLRAKAGVWTGLSAVAGALVLTPFVPGFGSTALVELGEPVPSAGGRLTPFSQIRSRLDDERSQVMFTVESSTAAYWRLTSMEFFDGRSWRVRGDFTWSNGEIHLAGIPESIPTQRIDQEFRIRQLRGNWLPAAHAPVYVDGQRVRVDSKRHILRVDDLTRGDTFKVTSGRPRPTLQQVRSANAGSAADLEPFLQITPALAFDLSGIAREMSQQAHSDYEQAVAIQDHLRSFTYSLDVPARHDARFIIDFLTKSQTGYCEQFAGAMALLLRSVGIPSRVAIGFLPGTENAGVFTVTNQEAHAWTEAYFDGVGWLAFEPTPRSEADPPSYTRATEASTLPGFAGTANPGGSTSSARQPSEGVDEEAGSIENSSGPGASTAVDVSRRAAGIALLLLIGVTAAMVFLKQTWIAWWTARARTPSEKVSAIWRRLMVDAEMLYRPVERGETESEYLAGLATRLCVSTEVFEGLRSTELKRAYGRDPISTEESERTMEAGIRLRKMLWRSAGWWDRARLLASPSPWLRALASQ